MKYGWRINFMVLVLIMSVISGGCRTTEKDTPTPDLKALAARANFAQYVSTIKSGIF